MKKEKQVRTYQRRTKSGKMVTVKAHTAKYDAAEKAKEAAKKEGAGKELEERKKKPVQLEIPFDNEDALEKFRAEYPKPILPSEADIVKHGNRVVVKGKTYYYQNNQIYDEHGKRVMFPRGSRLQDVIVRKALKEESAKKPSERKTTKKVRPVGSGTNGLTPKGKSGEKVTKTTDSKSTTSEPAFTAAEFKEWYNGTGSAADKKVAKALRAQLGRAGYRKLEDEAIDNYSSRGHLRLFKQISSEQQSKEKGTKQVAGKIGAKKSDKVIKDTKTNKQKYTDKKIH